MTGENREQYWIGNPVPTYRNTKQNHATASMYDYERWYSKREKANLPRIIKGDVPRDPNKCLSLTCSRRPSNGLMDTMEKSRKFGLSALSDHGGGAYTVHDDESILLDPIAVAESGDVFDDCGTSYDLWISWRTDRVASIYRDDDGSWVSMLSLSPRAPMDRALEPLIHDDLDSAIIDTVNCVVEHDGDRDAHITKIANEVAGELTRKCGMEFEVFAERNLGIGCGSQTEGFSGV